MKIIIAGHGNMAKLFFKRLSQDGHQVISLEEWLPHSRIGAGVHEMVALHVGSGKQFADLIGSCITNRIPILNGSTGMNIQAGDCHVPVVNAENFALPILRVLQMLNEVGKKLDVEGLSLSKGVVESHQSTKKTVPGTAKRMAESIGLEIKDIVSIRDPNTQLSLGVPPEFLDGHGYHFVNWSSGSLQIQLMTKVNGRMAYYDGGLHLLKEIQRRSDVMEKGLHDVLDFLGWK